MPDSTCPHTRRAYQGDWDRFTAWCTAHGERALPAEPAALTRYLRDAAAGHAPATVRRWAAAIADRHRAAGYPSPTASAEVTAALTDIRAGRPPAGHRAAPLLTADIAAMVAFARKDTHGWAGEVYERRDTALLLIGYAGALRRTDLVGLSCADLRLFPGDGLTVRVQHGLRRLPVTAGHQSCPPCAALRWLRTVTAYDAGGRRAVIRLLKTAEPFDRHVCTAAPPRCAADAPVFRSIRRNGNLGGTALAGSSIHRVIRQRAKSAGFADEFVAALGVHSLRAGYLTQACRSGADAAVILRQTGHAGPAVLRRYLAGTRVDDHAVADLGL